MSASPFTNSVPRMNMKNTWLRRWIYLLAAGFMFAAVLLRSILIFQVSPLLGVILIVLLAWLLIFLGSTLLARRYPWASALLIGLEILLILSLLLLTHSIHSDFFAFLFAISGMQVMQQFTPKETAVVIGLSGLMTFLSLLQPIGALQALALTLAYTALSVFLAAYIGSTRRALGIQEQQQALTGELIEANHKLERYAQNAQRLATSRERQRLARELHDSVTQTIFSMTLVTQSARLLLDRDRQQVTAQLDRLDDLAQSALSEMQVLISHLAAETRSGSFLDALQGHLADRQRFDNLSVSLEVEGEALLTPAEEASLYRIAQEGLNNVVKHARTTTAVLRLHLAEPFWMEVEDRGAGFDPQRAIGGERMGLAGMRERAAEIGWIFMAESTPGQGTRIRVQKGAKGI
jgi:signal transduction histidine kinase